MKDFVEAYKEARAKAWEYMGAKRAGWVEPGKRTRENHAILVPRREAVAMADELATAVFAKEICLTWMMNLQGFMVQLAGPGTPSPWSMAGKGIARRWTKNCRRKWNISGRTIPCTLNLRKVQHTDF